MKKFIEYRTFFYSEYENVRVIVNNPCLEYWFLLHFVGTGRFYRRCSDATRQLEKHLIGYEKTEKYFKKQDNDIYTRLRPYLKDAIRNAAVLGRFDKEQPDKAMCEMDILLLCEELEEYFK